MTGSVSFRIAVRLSFVLLKSFRSVSIASWSDGISSPANVVGCDAPAVLSKMNSSGCLLYHFMIYGSVGLTPILKSISSSLARPKFVYIGSYPSRKWFRSRHRHSPLQSFRPKSSTVSVINSTHELTCCGIQNALSGCWMLRNYYSIIVAGEGFGK